MADHPNAELVRTGYNAFIAGDMEWLNEHLDDTIVWHDPGDNRFSGDFHGRDEVFAHLAALVAFETPEFDIHDVVANDDHAVALVTVTATKTDGSGESFTNKFVHVFHVSSGDEPRVLEAWIMNEDQAGVDKFTGKG
jgi:ketosteroid isomerase-like protein